MVPMASPGEKLSAKLTDEERRYLTNLQALTLKRYQFTPFYLCISVQTVSVHIAIPHPPLRGTFPSGEGFSPGSMLRMEAGTFWDGRPVPYGGD